MHFADSIIIFLIALVLFGPKRLPEIGKQIGKLLAEFRRASNDFKMQIDEELRAAEQQERQKRLEEATEKATAEMAIHDAKVAQEQAQLPADTSAATETTPQIMPPSTGETVSASSPYSPVTPPELPPAKTDEAVEAAKTEPESEQAPIHG
ncbi:twin-arginine translocase TatA/TatE family subunit [Silvibacterium acidisoli]|uniref:twin-arginine translocase TatA/TatE family subunit n=1 Tax=Acidobacteriaceae bacterium ZG23-2 TaxID=2883246 RepID=UPI00406CD3AA